MPFRRPLYSTDGDLREMTDAMIDHIRGFMAQVYLNDPSVNVQVINSGGNLGQMVDTRLVAGNFVANARRFPSEAETPEPGIVSIGYTRLHRVPYGENTTDPELIRFPVFLNSDGQVQAMSLADMFDTFAIPALASISSTPVYTVHTSNSLGGYNLVSSTPIFQDTRANPAAYSASVMPDTADKPMLIGEYWLHKINSPVTLDTGVSPLFITDRQATGLTARPPHILNTLYRDMVHAAGIQRVNYSINGSGITCGAVMVDTRLNGAGNYQIRFVNRNDYRAQEFPNGSPIVINSYALRQVMSI